MRAMPLRRLRRRFASGASRRACLVATGLLAVAVAVTLPTWSAPLRTQRESRGVVVMKQPAVRHAALRAGQPLPVPTTAFGEPLPGLTTAQRNDFSVGLGRFLNAESPQSGLGPIFNNNSCISCHGQPAPGGGSPVRVTRFGQLTGTTFDPLEALGGSLQQVRAIDPQALEVVPAQANVVAQRLSTPLFGLGLIEAIPDETILANAERQKALGLNGVPALVNDVAAGRVRVGRFGWKAQQATLLAFSADAFVNEMGITNRLFPAENAPNGNAALLARFDRIADPEDRPDPVTGKADIDVVAEFMRYLAAPPSVQFTPTALQGRQTFEQIGCGGCHMAQMTTGPSDIAALNFKALYLYSDLLLHDMGSLGDGIVQGTAGPRDMRTAPLWGLRARAPYLHDGRAGSVDRAIQLHDGEAVPARNAYQALTATQRQQLLEFLGSI